MSLFIALLACRSSAFAQNYQYGMNTRVLTGQMADKMTELGVNTWVVVPIIEGMGYWAVNPKRVGQFKPIPGRHEFGDVAERMPRPEQKPWN